MASINDLKLTNDKIDIPEEIPEQFGSFAPPPQPGPFRFKLPDNLSKIWELVDVRNAEVKKKLGGADKALVAIFSNDYPLIITQSRAAEYDNDSFVTRINIAPRHRGNQVYVSDMYYFLEKGLGHDMTGCKTWSQKQWADAFISHGGEEFAANIEWSAYCNPDKVRYIAGDDDNSIEDPSGTTGCDTNHYKDDIPKNEDGTYALRFECTSCTTAVLRCYANLTNFRAVSKD